MVAVGRKRSRAIGRTAPLMFFALFWTAPGLSAQSPPLPRNLPVWLVGNPGLDGTSLQPYEGVRYALGRASKEGPLELGETIEPGAFQLVSLRAETRDGRAVWVRTAEVFRAGDTDRLVRAEIVMDRRSLAPISSSVTPGGVETVTEYDWDSHTVRDRGAEGEATTVDLKALEAGAHETWMAALPWRQGLRVMLPAVLGASGGKWWVVPRLVGTELIDLGDGVSREAWVVELDWWGMGPAEGTHTAGGGVNGTAGPGGKYWVLVDPPAGVPPVVRIRTEIDAASDNVVQIQRGM